MDIEDGWNGMFGYVCVTQGSLVEITNQRFSLKYQTFRQLAPALISDEGSSKLPKCL